MSHFAYLGALLVGMTSMLLIDYRFRLFFWRDAASAALVAVAGTVFLLLWDAAGIAGGIFIRGTSEAMLGIDIAPQMPLEEPFFLMFLVLCTMILYTGAEGVLRHYRERGDL
ncbi:lycopene cyclase domain-containing protein [Neomicrococcus aestuarii]|uniref:Lycopene cyclase domain-containing protein n=2 Tax=Neomicrococcus aestuarii TaxID=556325 RepID=A0A7W8TSU2_9MICC|nr:lycopene cyclase domain-containing protein [Neomicrococcus aestuarii]MBB5512292.1 lycopene cyclase domain-containing protein [Neomicrococcus aestuarii]